MWEWTSTTWFGIAGLGLDLAGAALLAYDAVYAPRAQLHASQQRTRLAIAKENRARYERSLQESAETPTASEARARSHRQELAEQLRSIEEATVKLRYWAMHERRAQLYALGGLVLLMAGFGCQAVSTVLSSFQR